MGKAEMGAFLWSMMILAFSGLCDSHISSRLYSTFHFCVSTMSMVIVPREGDGERMWRLLLTWTLRESTWPAQGHMARVS